MEFAARVQLQQDYLVKLTWSQAFAVRLIFQFIISLYYICHTHKHVHHHRQEECLIAVEK